MNLSDPTQAITPTLDGPVLAVLARSGHPLTVGEVAAQAARGSEIGIRKCLARLVDQGIVRAVEMGRNRVHELNRDHVAADVALGLADLRLVLIRRLKEELASWNPKPIDAWLFGSAARGDGDATSDIDILLVRRPRAGESPPVIKSPTPGSPGAVFMALIAAWAQSSVTHRPAHLSPSEETAWLEQLDRLRALVHSWTGNRAQLVELSVYEASKQPASSSQLLENVRAEGIHLVHSLPNTSPLLAPSRT